MNIQLERRFKCLKILKKSNELTKSFVIVGPDKVHLKFLLEHQEYIIKFSKKEVAGLR